MVIMTRSVETVALNTSIETYLNPDVEGLLVREKFTLSRCYAAASKESVQGDNWDRGIATIPVMKSLPSVQRSFRYVKRGMLEPILFP